MKQLVIIAGPPRSGTTLLRTTLNKHPKVATTPEIRFFDTMWGERLHPKGIKHVLGKIADKLSSDTSVKLWGPKSKDQLIKELLPAEGYRALFLRTLAARASKKEYDVIVEKTPMNALFVPTIRRWFPDAKLVVTMRDGREVSASVCKKWYTKKRYLSVAALWAQIARRYLRDVQNRKHLLLRYEDITSSPEAVFTKLFSYLGLLYDPAYVKDIETTSSFDELKSSKGIHKSAHARVYFPEKERMYMEYFLRKYLLTFDYTLEFSSYQVPFTIRLRWAYHSLSHWLSLATSKMGMRWWYRLIRRLV